jgi:ribosomal protein S27AE
MKGLCIMKRGLSIKKSIIRKKKRACLRCGESFFNKGPHNCICDRCTVVNERTSEKTYSVRGVTQAGSGSNEGLLLPF